jgi:predicted RNase H-like HicB family nuclease
MPRPERRVVQPSESGGWDVVKPSASRASAHTDTQAAAITRAREILQNTGGGELEIRGRNGQIRDSDTVAPSNDPNPPRDRR